MLKTFLLISLFSVAAQANLSQSACKSLLTETARLVQIAQDRFGVGELNRSDVAGAELEHLDAQFDCRAILFGDYCTQAVPTVKTLVETLKELEKLGQVEFADVVRAQKKQVLVDDLCK